VIAPRRAKKITDFQQIGNSLRYLLILFLPEFKHQAFALFGPSDKYLVLLIIPPKLTPPPLGNSEVAQCRL
jgi:hypothetical protein